MISDRFRKGDIAACVLVLALALALGLSLFFYGRGREARVVIRLDGEQVFSCALEGAEERVEVGGDYPLTVAVSGGEVWVEESSCPGGDCRRQGRISRPGQSVVCLPDRVTVAIEGAKDADDVDIVVG